MALAGNIALKVAEGTALLLFDLIREQIRSSFIAKIAGAFVRPAMRAVYDRVNPSNYNGGVFLGLNGLAIKSHGGCDAHSFSKAIEVAYLLGQANLTEKIKASLPHAELEKLTAIKQAS